MADNVVDILLRARMEAGDVASGVNSIQKALNGLTLPKNISGDLEKSFGRLGPLLKDYQKQLDKGFKTPKDLKNLELLKGKISDVFGEIKSKVQQVNGQEIRLKTDTQAISKLEKELDGLQTKLSDKLNNIYKSGQTGKGISQGIGDLQRALSAQFKSGNFKFPALKELTSGLRQALNVKDFAGFNNQIDNIRDKINSLSASSKFNIADSLGLKYVANDANSAGNAINTFLNKLQVNKNAANSIETLRSKIAETGTTLQQLKFDSAVRGAETLGNASAGLEHVANALSNVNQNASGAANGILSMQQQVDQLKTSTQYFFSLRNMINLLRRGVSQAVDTIKELDAAMTQTAVVVPEWDVGDMWAKLPEYTQNANKLGSTVVDLYKATTLYYQQGLRGNEVMDIAAETMKMARIGGLEAADATDKMTAALRGFNMEINATSAQRVNDVYSNLAANTASNTEELGTAMQRTASIAASAGMSFEGTAAFLAQAIETTREPAENLGTAMKTIVARFTELKKNPLEITEVDGEEVSYNKVDAALQSIGVSLKDTNGQFRDLDQVFLDISQRWDNLTQTQQRYVATQAAGSRQQSRFIAMMSNYQRTTELMDFANNSEGASQEQFEKTMESLEAKMNKLKNAWDAFLMGITDNQIVKGAVDGLTGLVDGVNKLIDALSLGVGPLKSFMSLMTAFVGLKMGGRFINSAIGGLGGMVDPTSSFSAGFKGGMVGRGNPALASQIYNPIVAAIHELGAAMGHTFGNGNGVNSLLNKTADQVRYDAYKSAHQEFKNMAFNRGNYENKNATVNDLTNALSKLDTKDQNLLGKSFFNTTNAAKQATFGAWAGKAFNYDKSQGRVSGGHAAGQIYSRDAIKMLNQADKAIYANVKDNSLPLSEYFKRIQDPTTIRQALEGVKGGTNSPVYGYFQHLDEQGNKEAEKYINSDAFKGVADKINNSNKLTDEQKQAALNKWKSTDHAANAKGAYFANLRHQGETPNGEETFKNSPVGKALDHISGFGSSMASAGMGLRSFGSLLQQSANPAIATFGTALTTMGSLLSGVGMGITGLTSAFSSASASIATATGLATGAATALTAGLFGLVAAVGLAIAMEQKRREDIKKRAEEITTNYKDKSKETTSNISNLQSWQEEMPRLAKGVDSNGNNINLDASDYQQYLEIADSIAEMNPEIVKGYNAQGHAIIDNNTALQKTLELQKKNQKLAVEEYTSDDSIRALIEARDLNKTTGGYTGGKRTAGGKYTPIEYQESMLAPQQTMMEQAKKMSQTLAKAGLSNKDFKDFGLDLSALEQGNQEAITVLSNNIDKIKARAKAKMQELGDEVSDDTKEAFDKSVSGFTDAAGELDEMITPLYDALSVKMSNSKAFQDIPDEMVTYFNQGLKGIASNSKLGFDDMMQESRQLANEFTNLTAKGSDYDNIMADIEEAQQQFGEDLDAGAYKKTADEAVSSLEEIKDGIDSTTGYGQALTEFLDNEIAKISNFTEEGAADVADALNTMTDEISAAEGAVENFKKVEEGSNFSTAAKGMKEIYDTVTEAENGKVNEHKAGKGDQTYWAAAENLFGRDNLKNASKAQVDQMLKNMEPMLQEGEAGWKAFQERWFKAYDEGKLKNIEGLKTYKDTGWLKSITDEANPEVYTDIANALQMSEDALVSMLNKGRQFNDIDFTNWKEVREGLATSDSVIAGQSKEGKKRTLYMKDEALNAELANAGITGVKEQEDYKKKLASNQNIKVITEAAKIGLNEFKDMGIRTQESLITTLGETGQYSKEEIQAYAERYAKINKETFDKAQFNQDWKHYEAAADPVQGEQLSTLESLDTTVMSILKNMQSEDVKSGNLADFKGKDLKKEVFGGKGTDTAVQWFGKGYTLDKNGETHVLSPKEYEATNKKIDNQIKNNEEYLKQLEVGKNAAKAAGNTDQVKKYEQEIKDVTAVNKHLKYNQKAAKVAYEGEIAEGKAGVINTAGFKTAKGKGIDINSLDTSSEDIQKALQQVYKKSMNPGGKLTQGLMENMELLGIDVGKAIEDGLVVDPNKVYQKAKNEKNKKNNAEQQGEDEADQEDTNKKKGKGKDKQKQKNAAEQQGEDEANQEENNKKKEKGKNKPGKDDTGEKSEEEYRQQREESERKEREQEEQRKEAARKAQIAAEQRDRENEARFENAETEKRKQAALKKQQQAEAERKARIAGEQRNRENEARAEQAEAEKKKQEVQKKQQQKEAARKAEIAAEQRDKENEAKTENAAQEAFKKKTESLLKEGGKSAFTATDALKNSIKKLGGSAATSEKTVNKLTQKNKQLADAEKNAGKGADSAKKGTEKVNQSLKDIKSAGTEGTKGISQLKKELKTLKPSVPTETNPSFSSKKGKPTLTLPSIMKAEQKDNAVNYKVKSDDSEVKETAKTIDETSKKARKGAKYTVTAKYVEGKKKTPKNEKRTINYTQGNVYEPPSTFSRTINYIKGDVYEPSKTFSRTVNYNVGYVDEPSLSLSKTVSLHLSKSSDTLIANLRLAAKGMNNHYSTDRLPALGSLAKGNKGRIGPKGKGGLTLTGEEGYEVAWLPRENRSMILGAKGPEMLNLPKDAVVWDHEQSKKIVKKQQFSSGSAWLGAGSANETNSENVQRSTQQRRSGGGNDDSDDKKEKKKKKKNTKKEEDLIIAYAKLLKKAGKISTWWDNISKQIEGTERIANKNQKAFEKVLNSVGTSLAEARKSASKYASYLKREITLNKKVYNTYDKQLKAIDKAGLSNKQIKKRQNTINKYNSKGTAEVRENKKGKAVKIGKKKVKDYKGGILGQLNWLQVQLAAAEETDGKKDDKRIKGQIKALKRSKRYKKALRKIKKDAAFDTVSWDQDENITYYIKNKKGKTQKKTKKKKVKQTRAIDFSRIISYDKQSEQYMINDKLINKLGKSKEERKAIKEKAQKLVDEKTKRRNDAKDKYEAAQEALDEMAEKTYQMFNRWERSLTRVYLISQQLSALQKKAELYGGQEEYLSAKATAGFSTGGYTKLLGVLQDRSKNLFEQAQANKSLIDATYNRFADSLNLNSYMTNSKIGNKAGGTSESGVKERNAAVIAFEILKKANALDVDTYDPDAVKQAILDYRAEHPNLETDEKVVEILDRIEERREEYYDAYNATYESMTNLYKTLTDYREYINEFEESLLKGLEDQLNKQIEQYEKLNSALTDAFKDLLDEVKRRLDERRKKEDNAKTESDISKKQQRLAALRADTSGSKASEIKQLEQEIADAQQQYGRSLEDQLIDKLQQQGDEAAKQRERQIKLLEIQRDLAQATGSNLEEVKKWLERPEENKEKIKAAWLANQNYDEALPGQRKQLERDFEAAWEKYQAYGPAAAQLESFLNGIEIPEGYQKDSLDVLEEINKKLDKILGPGNEIENPAKQLSSIKAFKEAGMSFKQARKVAEAVGMDEEDYSYKAMKKGGYTAKDFKQANVSFKDAEEAGFTDKQLYKGGYTAKQFRNNGRTAAQAAKVGFSYKQLLNGGYSKAAVAKLAQQKKKTTKSQSSIGAIYQRGAGTSARATQAAINTLGLKGNSAMGGVQGGTVKVDLKGKKNDVTIGDSHISNDGRYIGANKGSTLYYRKWSKKKGQGVGKWYPPVTIDKLTTGKVKNFPIDAVQALKYAITHTVAGGLINKNFKALITQAGLKGQAFKIKSTEKQHAGASLAANGKIYWAYGKNGGDGIKIWDPSKKNSIETKTAAQLKKALKDKKTRKAKAEGSAGREYKQFFKANKLSYKTGGMSYTTGPAWLDGTRAKPEAVLNAAQTKNFLQLRDILSNVMGHITDNNTTTYGDSTYEININVDHLNNDYDVDKVAKRVEKIITQDAGYRNVTAVRNFR